MEVSTLKMESILAFVGSFRSKNEMIAWFTKYCCDDLIVMVGDDALTLDTFRESNVAIIESSPNPMIDVFDIYKQTGGVIYLKCQISGKHTGRPYSYLDYPALDAAGCVWKNDPEILTFTKADNGHNSSGKIGKITIQSDEKSPQCKNGFMGPKGIYQQISLHSPLA